MTAKDQPVDEQLFMLARASTMREPTFQEFKARFQAECNRARKDGATTPIAQYDEVTAIAVKELCEQRLQQLLKGGEDG